MLPEYFQEFEKKNKLVRSIFILLRKGLEESKNLSMEIASYFRKLGVLDSKYSEIKRYKNIHQGDRCFIIATGPSLTMDDVEKLRNEYTFTMNSMCLALKSTDWRPTYYAIQDIGVYEKIYASLNSLNLKDVFIGSSIAKKYRVDSKYKIYPLNISYHLHDLRFNDKYHVKLSDDAHRMVYDGYTITYSIIQLAIYMGFNEIYFLGADTNYEVGKKHHFIEHGKIDNTFKTAKERMLVGYEEAHKYSQKNNIKIFNATRGGMLEIFPRVDLDAVINNSNN